MRKQRRHPSYERPSDRLDTVKHWSRIILHCSKKDMLLDRYDTTMHLPSYEPHLLPPPLPSQLLAGLIQLDASISIITIGLAKVVIVHREYRDAMCGIGIGYV